MKQPHPASITRFLAQGAPHPNGYPDAPFTVDVKAGKTSSFYRTHTYHTKVPPQGIERFIAHYTQPGQIVLDPFCGSGMTGVAAIRQQRRAVLSDISPAAAFFAYNHCRRLDTARFLKAGRRILADVQKQYGWLYETHDRSTGKPAEISKVIWSDVFRCPRCGGEYVLYEAALDAENKVLDTFPCPHCREIITKKASGLAGSVPVRIHYGKGGAQRAAPDERDRELVRQIDTMPWPDELWHPSDPIPLEGDEIPRLHNHNITSIDQLFTRRNLLALAALWRAATKADADLRPTLMFAVTGNIQRASRLIKFIPSLDLTPGPIHGTMYVPSLSAEINVFQMFAKRLATVARHHDKLADGINRNTEDVFVLTQSATDLRALPDESIDYVFTDPPFGANIQYSELNLLWESWLQSKTDATLEAVVNQSQGKDIDDYGALMASAFREIRRVLRPDAWMTLVFHNTSGAVWTAIHQALADANLPIAAIHTFDKAHDTFKMVTTTGAVGYDVVVNCRKSNTVSVQAAGEPADAAAVRELLRSLNAAGKTETNVRRLHSQAIGHFLVQNRPIGFDYKEFRKIAEEEFTTKRQKRIHRRDAENAEKDAEKNAEKI